MRYRRLSYRYAMVMRPGAAWPLDELWPTERVQLLVQGRWQPAADMYETAGTVEVLVTLPGVDENDVEVQLFEDVIVVEGRRQLPRSSEAVYHVARIRQGPFQVVMPLPAPIDADGVQAGLDRGMLRITMKKHGSVR
jgi:HSP20 family protein